MEHRLPLHGLHQPHRHERGAGDLAAGPGAEPGGRVFEIISEINRRWRTYLSEHFAGDGARIARNAVIDGGKVHMANLCLAGCYMVNGVSGLHGDILKNDLFHDIYTLQPQKFTYVL